MSCFSLEFVFLDKIIVCRLLEPLSDESFCDPGMGGGMFQESIS